MNTFDKNTCNCGHGIGSPCADCNGQCEGERRKLGKLALLEARREIYVNRGRRALLRCLLSTPTATADDVIAAVELPPEIDPRCLGAVPGLLARAGLIRSAGFVKSARPQRHASYIQVWELAAPRIDAARWIVQHPDRPDPAPEDDGGLFDLDPGKERPAAATVGRI